MKSYFLKASIFILGVIVTVVITKTTDIIIPNQSVVIKQITDTINIVHKYNLPENLDEDSVRISLEAKFKNLELLNKYEAKINENIKKSKIVSNLIITQNLSKFRYKGYTEKRLSSFLTSDCPNLNSKFIDIEFNFLNPEITNNIAVLKIEIIKFDNNKRIFVLENYYEVKKENNFIRIFNDFEKGKYEIIYGFILKNDTKNEYPDFYLKKCILNKN